MTIEEVLAVMDAIYDDAERKYRTACVTDIPARGVDVDHDAIDEYLDELRRDWDAAREHRRHVLTTWAADPAAFGSSLSDALDPPRAKPAKPWRQIS